MPGGYGLPAEKGLNRAVWDFRTERTAKIDYGMVFGAGPGEKSVAGYRVAPGTYTVRLSLGDEVQEQTVEVIDALYKRIGSLQSIQKQVELRKTIAEEADDTEVAEAATALLDALETWQKSVTTPERETPQDVLNFAPEIDAFLANVYQAADSAVLGLTRGQTDRLGDLRPVWREAMDGWDELMAEDLPAFNRVAGPAVAVPRWE